MRLLRIAGAIALLGLVAPLSWGQLPASTVVSLWPQVVNGNDTQDHVDLAVHRSAALARAGVRVQLTDATTQKAIALPYSASWQSSDPAIATVTAGTVTAKKAGSAQISVTVSGGRKASLWVCVADTGAAFQPIAQQWPAVTVGSASAGAGLAAGAQPPLVLVRNADTTRFAAVARDDPQPGFLRYEDALIRGKPWPLPCLHWTSTDVTKLRVVDRKGGLVQNVAADSLLPGPYVRVRVGPP